MNTISRGSKISGLSISAMAAHVWKVNSVVLEYKALSTEYENTLTFTSKEVGKLQSPYDDVLVISLNVVNILLRRIIIDIGSSKTSFFFWHRRK